MGGVSRFFALFQEAWNVASCAKQTTIRKTIVDRYDNAAVIFFRQIREKERVGTGGGASSCILTSLIAV